MKLLKYVVGKKIVDVLLKVLKSKLLVESDIAKVLQSISTKEIDARAIYLLGKVLKSENTREMKENAMALADYAISKYQGNLFNVANIETMRDERNGKA